MPELHRSAWIWAGLLLAAAALADDYPAPTAFVNDFANQLPAPTVQALEKKVHAYERATGNEIAVVVVPSLNGMLVDDYARGLFHAWGVGKRELNNGVLFVWAPKERRIRIEVGTGLGGVLTDEAAGRIVSRVRDLFRSGRYDAGVNAAVDGIIKVLGTGPAGAAAPDARNFVERNSPEELARQRQAAERQRQEQARQQEEEDAARAAKDSRERNWIIGWAGLFGVVLYVTYRRWRAARLERELPGELAAMDREMAEEGRKLAQAQAALSDLRKEAPADVYQQFEAAISAAPDDLRGQQSDLQRIQALPRATYRERKAVHQDLVRWRSKLHTVENGLDGVQGTLETFREQRRQAQEMLVSIPQTLVRMQAEGVDDAREGLLRAAADTYAQAVKMSKEDPANWLLVYDLLADVSACLERIANPAMGRYSPQRFWDAGISPAAQLLAVMYAQQAMASQNALWNAGSGGDEGSSGGDGGFSGSSDSGGSSGGDSGGFSGGSDSGGFGGGDSSGGGASSDY